MTQAPPERGETGRGRGRTHGAGILRSRVFPREASVRLSSDPAEVVQRAACTTVSHGQPQTTEWAAGPAGRRAFRLPGIQRPGLVPAMGPEMEKLRQQVCRAEGEQAGHQGAPGRHGPLEG